MTKGLNPYDTRLKCDRNGEDGPLCYRQMKWIETYLNKGEVKGALGVPSKVNFQSCNMAINQAFALSELDELN
jgi:cathepsin A (carboxypeptidase C)